MAKKRKASSLNRRIVKGYLKQWRAMGHLTWAEARAIMRSEGNNTNTPHLMACTASTNIRRYWVGWVEASKSPLVG